MKYIFSIYLWLVVLVLFTIATIILLLSSIFFSTRILHYIVRFFFRQMLNLTFLRPKIVVEQQIDKSKAYIYMPNHVSMTDVMMIAAYAPTLCNGIEAHTHFKWPIYGLLIKLLKQIPINRTSAKESLQSFEIAKQRLQNGWSIVVYPEGTRSNTGQLKEFKKMPFKFAKETQNSIIPVCFIGVENLAPENSLFLKHHKVKLIFGNIIDQHQIQSLSAEDLMNKVRSEIIRMSQQYANI